MKARDRGPLEAARKSKGWSQSELTERSGVQQGNISVYERGNIPLGIAAAKKLGKALDADPALLMIYSQKARLDTARRTSSTIRSTARPRSPSARAGIGFSEQNPSSRSGALLQTSAQ
jgi:transcriptional regulator with XRE-family HTH domain